MKIRNSILFVITALTTLFLTACSGSDGMNQSKMDSQQALSADVITAEEQASLTPDQILEGFREGNERFVNNDLTPRDYQAQVEATASGQYPEAVVISCIDSRVPVEHVFDKGIGDIFVARVAGNFVNEDILGSAEFATAVAGAKVVIVMGHESCGAVKGAIDDVQMGNLTAMLAKIKPAVEMSSSFSGEQSSSNSEFVTEVVNNNVRYTLAEMREKSPIIAELERNGELVIAGAFYDLDTGKVTFLE